MIYALVHYPKLDSRLIDQLRQKYDPQFGLIDPHITVMFPVRDSIDGHNLVSHLENVLSDCRPFSFRLQGLQRSWDECLFLLVREGSSEIVRLHNRIYRGILADYKNSEVKFIPHLTLGAFDKDAERYAQALSAAKALALDYRCVLNRLDLVKVNDERTRIVWGREFVLK
jgi:2'-5' RNA ligase